MTCEKCKNITDQRNVPHTIRVCENCGRTMYVRELGKHGKSINIRQGDTVVIPKNWLNLSFSPLKGTGRFTKAGLQWFAKLIFLEDLPNKRDEFPAELTRLERFADEVLSNSDLLKDLDINNPDHSENIIKILEAKKDTAEWWAFLSGVFIRIVNDATESNDVEQAIWAMACAERCRSMVIFKNHLEEAIWMGHSARPLVDMLKTWDSNKFNKDEEFWQQFFAESSLALSQIFSVPVVFINDKAYVGGMNFERKDARFVDYLFSSEFSKEVILIEIKTPITNTNCGMKDHIIGAKIMGEEDGTTNADRMGRR